MQCRVVFAFEVVVVVSCIVVVVEVVAVVVVLPSPLPNCLESWGGVRPEIPLKHSTGK